jgi:hypothetical protein
MPCVETLIGTEAYFVALALAVGVLVRVVKRVPKISPNAVPVVAFALGYLIDAVLGYHSCGLTFAEASLSGFGGGLAGLAAAGGHEALMRSANTVGLGKAAAFVLGKATQERAKRIPPVLLLLGVFTLSGCAGVLDALVKTAQGAQWIGTVVDVAEAGAEAYFDRHPNLEDSRRVEAATRRTRSALAALDALLAVADAAGEGDVERAKQEALKAYAELRSLLAELGVLSATPPAGGAESDAPEPLPFELPTPEEIGAAL